MKLLVIGCKLQGTEAIYLAKKAGFFVTAVDRSDKACGSRIADCFVQGDVNNSDLMLRLFNEHDVVLPAVEDNQVCSVLLRYGKMTDTPVIFDERVYKISSSKKSSNELFKTLGLSVPRSYPECGFPVIIKPDNQSGSSGVKKVNSASETEQYLSKIEGSCVVQEYLEGRSFSLEVLSLNGEIRFPMITEVLMDDKYDCSRIVAPAELSADEEQQMYHIARILSDALNIQGIFDIEVISHHGTLKLLEIDARLPSQTPISVYHASGFNMVEWLVKRVLNLPIDSNTMPIKICWYQQIMVTPDKISVLGEHIIADAFPLHHEYNFFGADEALTDYTPECCGNFRAIIIVCGKTERDVRQKFLHMLKSIQKQFQIEKIEDSYLKTGKEDVLCRA